MMIKALVPLALFFTSTAAYSAGTGPEIAYAKDGSRPEIYLVNSLGGELRLIYRGASRTKIFGVDLKPGGGEVSFEEVPCCSSGPGKLQTVAYAATGTLGTVTRSIPTCRVNVDYHPTDGSLLLSDTCERKLKRLAAGSSTPVDVGVPGLVFKGRWLSDGVGFLYAAKGSLWRSSINAPTTATVVRELNPAQYIDAGHATPQVLLAADQVIDLLDLATGNFTARIERGADPKFSPTDVEYISMTPPERGSSYLMIRRVDGSGAPTRIGAKAAYTSVDWRN